MVVEIFTKGSRYKQLVGIVPKAMGVMESDDWLFISEANGREPESYSLLDYEFRITK